MKPNGSRKKGRDFEKLILNKIKEKFNLSSDDIIRSGIFGGEDIKLSQSARSIFPYSIECKKRERIDIWDAINQNRKNAVVGEPIVIFSKNREDIYTVMRFEHFLDLLHKEKYK